MGVQFDPCEDFSIVVDRPETVTLRRSGSSIATSTSGALRSAVTTQEAESSQGKYTRSDVVWHLPASDISGPPTAADAIIDSDGACWTILAVARTTAESRWRCVCRNLAIAHGLDQLVDIEMAVNSKDARGARQTTWQLWRTGLAAKIQALAADNSGSHQQDVTVGEFRVYLADAVEVDHTHRLKGPDGTRYRITGFKKPDRIDALLEIHAVRIT